MSVSKRIAFAVSASWFSRFVTIGLNLIFMPILFRHLGQEELGLWFMLGQSGAFLGLMDFGIAQTLTRRIALAKGKSGADPTAPLSYDSRQQIADLVASGRIIYRYLTLAVFLIAWGSGFVFIGQIELQHLDHPTIWLAWTIMCLCHAVGVWATMWGCLLQGVGFVGWDALLSTCVSILTICAQIATVLLGGSLVELATIATIGALTTRYSTLLFAKMKQPALFAMKGRWNANEVRSMALPAFRAWLTGLGAFLILKTDQYFIVLFKGAADIPSYHAASQLISNLHTLAVSFAMASGVFISHLWQAQELTQLHLLVQRNSRLGLSIMACGVVFFFYAGQDVIELWLGKGHFIGYPVLLVFCIMLTLETQHVIIAAASRATEDEAFASWALGAGLLNLGFTWVLIKYYGLLGVALGTMLAQMLTNNWYVVYRGLWRLKMSRKAYLIKIAGPVSVVFVIAFLGVGGALHAIPMVLNGWIRLLVTAGFCGVCLIFSLWFFVLNRQERRLLLEKMFFWKVAV